MTRRILIASTVQPENKLMASVLRKAQFLVDVVESIEQAVSRCGQYNLIIIDADFVSPGGGWLLAKQLRSSFYAKKLWIIILIRTSSYEFVRDFSDFYDQVLFLPISHEELIGNVERVMETILDDFQK